MSFSVELRRDDGGCFRHKMCATGMSITPSSSFKSPGVVCHSLFSFCPKDCSSPRRGWPTGLNPEERTTQNQVRANWRWPWSVSEKLTFLGVSCGAFRVCYRKHNEVYPDRYWPPHLCFLFLLRERGVLPSASGESLSSVLWVHPSLPTPTQSPLVQLN